MLQIKKGTGNLCEHKVGNNANIANFVCLWKTRMPVKDQRCRRQRYDDGDGIGRCEGALNDELCV